MTQQPITSLQELGNLLGFDLELPVAAPTSGTLGFYGVAAVTRPSAYSQTFSTASKSIATPPTLVGSDYASEAASIQAALEQLTQNVNAIIDDLQALGLVS